MASSISKIAICCFFALSSLVGLSAAVNKNPICPFDYLFHLGDGVFDNGNAIRFLPVGRLLPAARWPYGMTTPGYPTGRWSDGLLDIDIGATAMGFPQLTPYLDRKSRKSTGIIFAVAKSPVLDANFFRRHGVKVPFPTLSLNGQLSWLKYFIKSICYTPSECRRIVGNSLILFGDVEANDIAIPLLQGKSIKEVATYIPLVNRALANAAREVIRMGATRVILPGNNPIGCYPYLLTELGTNNPDDYDDFGCLKKVNELIKLKNKGLQKEVKILIKQNPNVTIFYADFYTAFEQILRESLTGLDVDRKSTPLAMKACCGIGGKYNYNKYLLCGTRGIPVCKNPKDYIHWDGRHLTEDANNRLSLILQKDALETLGCKKDNYNIIRSTYYDNKLSSSM